MTQEQLEQIEAWRESLDVKMNDENIVNAMWLAEEMWERHHAAMRSIKNIEFSTYMMAFCMTLMEYIWMPHDIIKAITAYLDFLDTMPEEFICTRREVTYGYYMVDMSYIACNIEACHDYEKRETIKLCDTKTEAEALTAILTHANKAGHDAVKRLSA
jgi:hypothetical protein